MPVKDKMDKMITMSECTLPRPKGWPGKYNKNHRSGTLISKEDWRKEEAKKWVDEMKKSVKYDDSYFSVKALRLQFWLRKTFPKISIKEARTILYELEEVTDDVSGNDETLDRNEDEDGNLEAMETDDVQPPGSPDLFDSDPEQMEEDEQCRMNRHEKDILIKQSCENIDKEMIENEETLPDFVKHSRLYKEKKDVYIRTYIDKIFETSSSQDVATSFTQLPGFVKDHKYVHEKLSHRSKEEMSSWRILKNINDVCKELRKDPSQEAFQQRVVLTASVICPRYGVPKIDETESVINAAKKVKKAFCIGEQNTLKINPRKKREIFPKEVFDFATESWETGATIPEPAQHRRPESAPNDGMETIPARLQILTDGEAYEQFKDKYQEKVRGVMGNHCEKMRDKYRNKTESVTKEKILETLSRKEMVFPSKSWFLLRKPPQTKVNYDHTTGLCKDCHSNHLNYESLHKFCKKFCHCKTHQCPNWICVCPEEEEDCKCKHECECDDCMSCQVSQTSNLKI